MGILRLALYWLYKLLLLSFYCFTFVCSFILRLLLLKVSLLTFPILYFEIHVQTKINQLKDFSNTNECFSNLLIVRTKSSYLPWYLILKVFILPLAKTCLLKSHTEITDEDINLIMKAWKTLLSNVGICWVKKERTEDFCVLIGCFDDIDVCYLVRSYILKQ